MDRLFWQIVYWGVLLAILVVPFAAGRVLLRRLRSGAVGRLWSIGLYALATLAPPALYLSVFFALVGIEELTGSALIPEEIGRSLLLVVSFGLLVWLLALVIYVIGAYRATRSRISDG